MVEYDNKFLPLYQLHRKNSIHIIADATTVDYRSILKNSNMTFNLDYLQIDLEANNGSTLRTLQKLDREVFDTYKFATITFEHDIYHTNYLDTRAVSRAILKNKGYYCVFEDIHNIEPQYPYEDWYVHPDLVDMDYVRQIQEMNKVNYVPNNITGRSINWQGIKY